MLTQEYERAINEINPSEKMKNSVYIRNTVKAENVHIGEFTYYDTMGKDTDFERDNILYNYPGHGDLYIGKFTSIAYGAKFIMGAANHSIRSFSSYPFCQFSSNWAAHLGMSKEDMPHKGDTVIGNDVWIGREAKIMPGVTVGDGAIIGSFCVVAKDVPPYSIVVGNPGKVVKTRFDEDTICFLKSIKWWDFAPEYLDMAIPYITSVNIEEAKPKLRKIADMDAKAKGINIREKLSA